MSDGGADDAPATAAEQRLLAWIRELGAPRAGDELVAAIVRAARWQAVARPYLAAIGAFASALGAGARIWLQPARRR